MTAWTLGATWLAQGVLGMPLGVWLIALGLGVCAIMSRRWPGLTSEDLAAGLTPMSWRLAESLERLLRRTMTLVVSEPRARSWMASLEQAHDRMPWWESPLRIGIDAPLATAELLTSQSGLARVQWFEVTSSEAQDDPNAFCERRGLDAMVQAQPSGVLRVVTLRRSRGVGGTLDGMTGDAALPDWSFDRAITLGTLFPHRVDPGVVELAPPSAHAHRAAIELIVALSRTPCRLGLGDRLAGRRPMPRSERLRALRPIDQARTDTPAQLACAVLDAIENAEIASASKPLLRALSAWAASDPDRTPGFDDHARLEQLERLAKLCPSCVSTHLRLAAARFTARDDDSGLDALARAYDLLRAHQTGPDAALDASVHAAFLDEALRLSVDEPASVGRVAAGLTLLMVSTPRDQLDYLRDDLLDEARYAEWLIGRDPETTLLDQVFRRLAHSTPAPEQPELFPRRAA